VTRGPGGPRARTTPASRDPYGIGPVASYVGPILAVIGLLIVAILTINLAQGQIPLLGTPTGNNGGNNNGNGGGPDDSGATPAPSNIVITPPATTLVGSIVYGKAGNLWIQTEEGAHQLTDDGHDSMPAFSQDGAWIYFIRQELSTGKFPTDGNFNKARSWYDLFTPVLMRIKPDGTGLKRLLTGRYTVGSSTWFYWLRQPVPSPDGKTVTVISDGPNPLQSDIVLKSFTLATKELKSFNVPESSGLGHQDPAWRADGKFLLYVKNGREGTRGSPQIYRYDPATKKTRALTGPGYMAPSWSPNGRFIAATKTDAFGTDISILDAAGTEVLRVTDDNHSFSPVWSPAGDAIAYLHLSGTSVDLKLAKLDASSGRWAVTDTKALTEVSALDGTSRPSWFIPASQLPASTPSPAAPSSSSTAP
jgi:hypothetical protein